MVESIRAECQLINKINKYKQASVYTQNAKTFFDYTFLLTYKIYIRINNKNINI